MANESYRTKQLREELEKSGMFYKHHGFMTAGISDLIGCVTGRFVAIEAKLNKGKVTALQQVFLTSVVENGGVGFIARYIDNDGWEILEWATGVKNKVKSTKDAAAWLLNQVSLSTSKMPLITSTIRNTMPSCGSLA